MGTEWSRVRDSNFSWHGLLVWSTFGDSGLYFQPWVELWDFQNVLGCSEKCSEGVDRGGGGHGHSVLNTAPFICLRPSDLVSCGHFWDCWATLDEPCVALLYLRQEENGSKLIRSIWHYFGFPWGMQGSGQVCGQYEPMGLVHGAVVLE